MIVHRLEWEQATGVGGRLRGYLPQRWPDGLEPTLIDFDGEAVGPFRASYDVAGDGRLLLVPTPGHTAGHAALLVRDDRRSWLLAGDLAHTAAESSRRPRRSPGGAGPSGSRSSPLTIQPPRSPVGRA